MTLAAALASVRTVHVADDVKRHAVLDVDRDQALFLREVRVRAEDDLPDVPARYRLAVLEPRDHVPDEVDVDRVLAALGCGQLWPGVALVQIAATLLRARARENK